MVVARQKANPASPAWAILEDRWKATKDYAKTVVNAFEGGEASNRNTVDACRQLVALWDAVPPSQVVQMALAIYLQADDRPHRFKSDRAFGFQMVRRMRGLSTINAGIWWDPRTRKSKRVYKDLPPKTVLVMKELLVSAFGAVGLQLAGFERQRQAESEQARQRLAVAVGALK